MPHHDFSDLTMTSHTVLAIKNTSNAVAWASGCTVRQLALVFPSKCQASCTPSAAPFSGVATHERTEGLSHAAPQMWAGSVLQWTWQVAGMN